MRYGSSGRFLVELKQGPSPRTGLLEFRVAALLSQLHLFERALVLSFSAEHPPAGSGNSSRKSKPVSTSMRPRTGRPGASGPTGPGMRRRRAERLARDGPPDGRGARIGARRPRLDRERSRARAADGPLGRGLASSRTTPALVGPAVRAVTGARPPLTLV